MLPLPGRTPQTLASLEPGDTLPTVADVAPVVVSVFVQQSNGADEDARRRREHYT